jgi:hypothetical protein
MLTATYYWQQWLAEDKVKDYLQGLPEGSEYEVRMSDFGEVAAGSDFLSKIWITDYLQQPINATSTPTITLYDPLRNVVV